MRVQFPYTREPFFVFTRIRGPLRSPAIRCGGEGVSVPYGRPGWFVPGNKGDTGPTAVQPHAEIRRVGSLQGAKCRSVR